MKLPIEVPEDELTQKADKPSMWRKWPAPKSSSDILVWENGRDFDRPYADIGYYRNGSWYNPQGDYLINPTHWMPIEPPDDE